MNFFLWKKVGSIFRYDFLFYIEIKSFLTIRFLLKCRSHQKHLRSESIPNQEGCTLEVVKSLGEEIC